MKKIKNLNEEYDATEPVPCQRHGCEEEHNGLHHFWIDVGEFTLDTWLCEDCAGDFRKRIIEDL